MVAVEVSETEGAGERLHALDAVRGAALMLGVVFHATLSFLPGIPIWPSMDNDPSPALGVLFYVLHVFRMTSFFLIAGFFGRMSLDRRGTWGFVGDRLKRIALPLVVGWLILFPAILAVIIWSAVQASGGAIPSNSPPPPPLTAKTFPLTHLWFLYVLLIFYAGVLGLRGLVSLIDWKGGLRRGLDQMIRPVIGGPLAPLVMAAPLAAAFWYAPEWRPWFGVPTPDTGLIPNATALVAYGSAFGFGWLIQGQDGLIERLGRWWLPNLVLAVMLIAGGLAMVGPAPSLEIAAHDSRGLAYAACYALAAWTSTFAFIGLALRFLSGFSRTRRWIADASYWVYLVHLPIVMALQTFLAKLDLGWPVKFALILLIGFAVMFASYQLLVRYSFIGAVLNGRRRPPQKVAP